MEIIDDKQLDLPPLDPISEPSALIKVGGCVETQNSTGLVKIFLWLIPCKIAYKSLLTNLVLLSGAPESQIF